MNLAKKVFRWLLRIYLKPIQRLGFRQESGMHQVELGPDHFQKTKVLSSREEMLYRLPQRGVVAEIGVLEGAFASKILEICDPQRLILVDYQINQALHKRFALDIKAGKVQLIRKDSVQAAKDFPDHFFDWIYLDTDHSFQTTLAELEAYRTKIKVGGFIAGHDFMKVNPSSMMRNGVIEAVHYFCQKHQWQYFFLTMENRLPPSFVIGQMENS